MIASLAVLMLLAACGGPTTITGSGGDGPVTGGAVSVTDANGAAVITTPANPVTGSDANFSFTVPSNAALPLTITITGGTDTVTGSTQDFPLKTAITTFPANGTVVGNANPLTTLAVASALAKGALTANSLSIAITNVLNTQNFGLPAGFNPMTTKVDTTNVAAVVKANEAVAELIRRAKVSTGKTIADTITAIAEDITDGVLDGKVAVGSTATQATTKTAGVILTRQAEIAAAILADQLKITDKTGATKVTAANMKSKLNAAILVTQPAATGAAADVSQVKVPQKFIDQAINAISLANLLTGGGNATLNNLETAINALTANTAPGTTQAANILATLNNANTALGTANTNANAGTNTATVSTAATKTNAAPVFTGTPAISGTAAVGNTLSLIGTATSDADGQSLTLAYLWNANGAVIAGANAATYTVQAGDAGKQITAVITVDDGQIAANSATSVATASVTVSAADTTPPVLSSFTSTTADGSYKAGANINITATYNEALASTSTLTVSLNSNKTGLVLSTVSGSTIIGTYTVGANEDSADLTVSAITSQNAKDIANNALTTTSLPTTNIAASSAIVVDTTAPTQTFSALSFSADTGTSSSDFLTGTAAQTISATLSAGLGAGDKVLGSLDNGATWADISNKVSGTTLTWNTVTLAGGSNTLKLKVQDAVGNNGVIASQTYVLDTTAPAQTFSSLAFSADTGVSNTDFITNTTAQTITATLSTELASGDIVSGSLDNGSTWTDITAKVSGTTLTWNGVTLAASSTLKLKVTDTAGNAGTGAIASQAYVLDTAAPAQTFSGLAFSADTGASNTDFITNTTAQTITATLSAVLASGDIVSGSLDNGSTWTDITAKVSGTTLTWNGVTLAANSTLKLKVTDTSGNAGTGVIASQVYVFDTTVPTTTVATKMFSADTGSSATDFITKTAAQTISGTLSAVTVTGEIVEVSLDNGTSWTTAANTIGQNSWSLASQTLTGNNTLQVRVTDAAGNSGTASTQVYVLDTTAPTTTIATKSFSADTGSSTTDFITKTAAQTISGTLSAVTATGEIVEVSLDNGTSWTTAANTIGQNSWSLASQTLTGNNTLQVRVTDAAGNSGTASTQVYVLDTTAPTVSLHNPGSSATGEAVNAAIDATFSEAVTGVTTTSFTVTPAVGSALTGTTVNHNASNNESLSHANLVNGTVYTVALSNAITDLAGNALTATNWSFTTVQTYTVGGTVFGLLTGESVVLQDNGGDNLTVSAANGTFTFTTKVANTAAYSVTVLTPPTGKSCIVSKGSGTISGAAVSNVSVLCPSVPLNDTGIDTWANATVNNLSAADANYPGQDADNGRDAQAKATTLVKTGASTNANQGFDFTKLDSTGTALVNQAVAYATTPWDCVKDNHTGLMWEVKTTTAGTLRLNTNTYSWFSTNAANNFGNQGTAIGGSCTGSGCDTEKYVAAVNALTGANRICGFTDWRLPTRDELLSIVDYSIAAFGTTIDTGYFPNVVGGVYWSASPYASNATGAWDVHFGNGGDGINGKSNGNVVRLVRGGQ